MFRNFVRVVGLVGAFLYAVGVQALGLGDVQLNSGLNEPLDAEIKLLNTGDLNATQIIIKLASPEDFARAGAERDFFLTNFKYKTELDGQGGGVVKITTKELVREPYLNFLLEAKWPSGKLIREYTLLVDLPVFKSTNTAPRVSQAPAQKNVAPAAATSSRQSAVRKTQPTFTSRESAGAQADSNSGTLTTRRHDTLWKLALQVRPSASISAQKVMVAMQALNPEAFIDNNINLLKTGAVLRVPTLEDIERIDNDRAQIAVAEQNARWRSAATSGQRQLDATPTRSNPEIAEVSDTGRLRLTTSTSDSATGSGGTDSEAAGDGLSAKLLAAEESVEKANAENIELRSKVEDLEAELLELKNKLEIRDSALANLQNTDTTPAPVVAEADTEEAKADVAATKAETEEAVAEPDPTTPPAVAESGGLLDTILDNPLYVGGLGALALALLGGLFVARRRSTADEGFDVMAEFEAEADADTALEEAADELESFAEAEEEFVEQPQDFSEFELDSLDNEEAVESEIGDPVAEADIYMAYGRFPQAVELLNRALEQEPERTDLRVKLVEVHMGAGTQEAAEEQLAHLQNSGDAEALQQAQTLLGQDHETLDATIEQPELMDEFTQMLGENEAAEEFSTESDDVTLADAANEEFPGGLSLAEDDDFSSDPLTAEDGLSLDDGFDLELDLDDAVAETGSGELELDGLDLELPEGETELDIESELSDLTSDLGMGENELAADDTAKTVEFEPDLDLNVSDQDVAELEDGLTDQPSVDESHAELDLIDAADETATKIDLARAYIDMGDTEGAKDILSEVLDEAENEQLQEAQELLDRIA
ncbi:MAG: FimV/HubP family polar landmark protein [Pseudomonadales bacterium]